MRPLPSGTVVALPGDERPEIELPAVLGAISARHRAELAELRTQLQCAGVDEALVEESARVMSGRFQRELLRSISELRRSE